MAPVSRLAFVPALAVCWLAAASSPTVSGAAPILLAPVADDVEPVGAQPSGDVRDQQLRPARPSGAERLLELSGADGVPGSRAFFTNSGAEANEAVWLSESLAQYAEELSARAAEVAPLANADVIFCRNVFIYFSEKSIRRTVELFAASMPASAPSRS